MNKDKIQTNYVSPLDKFMEQFDHDHPELSKSQLKEREKYARIYYLRDVADRNEDNKLPEGF